MNLLAIHDDVIRGIDSDTNLVTRPAQHDYPNVPRDADHFTGSARQNQALCNTLSADSSLPEDGSHPSTRDFRIFAASL
jgi:hypothetical protein